MTNPPPDVLLELRPSRLHVGGVGVFAVRDIEEGEKVADGISEEDFHALVSWDFLFRCNEAIQRKVMAFCVGTPSGFVPPPNFDFNKLSIEWYLNHSCDGNCGFNDDGDFAAIRNVREGEELSYDYALVESNPRFSMRCECRSKHCRHVITGNDWKDEDFIAENRDHMHPHLRRLISVPA
jgi:SET domain-containing protein